MVAIVICCLLNIQIIHVGVFFLPRALDWMFMSHCTPTKVMCWEVIRFNVVTRVKPLWWDCVCVCSFSRVQIFVTPWTAAFQAPLSMGFSRQEYGEWVVFPFSRGSSQSRDWAHISCIGRQILYHWATKEAMMGLVPLKAEEETWDLCLSLSPLSAMWGYSKKIITCKLKRGLSSGT